MKVLVTGVGGPAGMNTVFFYPEKDMLISCDADEKAEKKLEILELNVKFYKVPYARDPSFLERINELIEKDGIDYIIPTVDEELVTFSQNKHSIKAEVIISPEKTIKICNDKFLLYEELKDLGVCPRFVIAKDQDELSVFEGAVIVKPRVGRGGRGIITFESYKDIPESVINPSNVFCEYLPGKEYTVDVLCDFDGNPLVIVPRIRLKILSGVSIIGKTERNKDVIKRVKEICNVIKFKGPVNIQFKLDHAGEPKLVEINPRFSGGLPITVASGVNPVELLYKLLKNIKIKPEELVWKEVTAVNEIAKKVKG